MDQCKYMLWEIARLLSVLSWMFIFILIYSVYIFSNFAFSYGDLFISLSCFFFFFLGSLGNHLACGFWWFYFIYSLILASALVFIYFLVGFLSLSLMTSGLCSSRITALLPYPTQIVLQLFQSGQIIPHVIFGYLASRTLRRALRICYIAVIYSCSKSLHWQYYHSHIFMIYIG